MSAYLITFVGHIDIHKRPDGFPYQIVDLKMIEANSDAGVRQAIDDGYMHYIRMLGMKVRLDPTSMESASALEYDLVWVPMHMITHINHVVQPVQTQMPAVLNIANDPEPTNSETKEVKPS